MATSGTKRKRIDSAKLDQMLIFKDIANTLNVSHSQVFHAKDHIRIQIEVEQIENQESKRRRITGSGRAPDVQVALLEWYHEAKLNNIPITGPILIYKANQLAARLNLDGFTASYAWLDKWGIRNDIWKESTKSSSLKRTPRDDAIIKDRSSIESNGIKGKSSISKSLESNGIEDKSSIPTSTERNVTKDKSSIPMSTEINGIKDKSSIPTATEVNGIKDKLSVSTPTQTHSIKDRSVIPTTTNITEIQNGSSMQLSVESNGIKDRQSTESIGTEDRSVILTPSQENSIKGKSAILTPSKSNVIEERSAIPKGNDIKDKSTALTHSKNSSTKARSSMLTYSKGNIIKRKSSILKPTPKHGIRDIRTFLTHTKHRSTNETHIVDTQLNLTFTKPRVIKGKQINLYPTENNGTGETCSILSPTGINSFTANPPVNLHACSIKQEPIDSTVCNTNVSKVTPPMTNCRPIKLESHNILTCDERMSSTKSSAVNLHACNIKQEPIDSSVSSTDLAKVTLPTTNFRPIKIEPVETELTTRPPQVLANSNRMRIKQEPTDSAFTATEETRRDSTSMTYVSTEVSGVNYPEKLVSTSTKHVSTSAKHISTRTHNSGSPSTPSTEFQKQTVPVTDAEAREAVKLLRTYCGQRNISAISDIEKRDDVIYDKIKRQTSIVDFAVKLGMC